MRSMDFLRALFRWRRSILAMWIGLFLAVIVGSLSPTIGPPAGPGMDKLTHFGAYALLTILPLSAVPRHHLAIALGILLAACMLEVAQGVMDWGRSASVLDAMANGAGIWVGGTFAMRLRAAFGRESKPPAPPGE